MKTAAALMMLFAPVAHAQGTTQADVLEAQLRPGWQTATGTHMAALELDMAPQWKTYWRAPGDAGIPPSFDWSGSQNVASVRFHWPAPQVFRANGLRTVGYHDTLMLPFEVTPVNPALPVRLQAQIELGVCKDICMPASLLLTLDMPVSGTPDAAITTALNARPATGAEVGMGKIECAVEPIRDGLRITARIDLPSQGREEVVVFEPGLPGVWVSEAVVDREGQTLHAVAEMVPPSGQPFALDRSAVTLTVIGSGGKAVEIHGCPAG